MGSVCMDAINMYLIVVNIISFIVFCINLLIQKYADKQIDIVVTFFAFLFGTPGIALGILLFYRKLNKENMMSIVFINCLLIIHVIMYLFIKGYIGSVFDWKIWQFFKNNKWLLWYLLIINIITMVVFAIDKFNAMENEISKLSKRQTRKSRYRIISLLALCFIGGEVGGFISMIIFRHKIRKNYFVLGLPLIFVMHIFLILYFMNV